MNCILCAGQTRDFFREKSRQYVQCLNCRSVLLLPAFYITPEEEKQRYQEHNNDVSDVRYQKFLHPVTAAIQQDFPTQAVGLDYGCGTGPVATAVLEKKGYELALFDPFFHNAPEVLSKTYDFIVCSEVMEHFHQPSREFRLLREMLAPGGKLYCKTSVLEVSVDFGSWYYKNDPTHVFFYSPESLEWIRERYGFRHLDIFPKLIVFHR